MNYYTDSLLFVCVVVFVYIEVQHEVTSVDDNNNPLRTSFHTDVSLLQRIDSMRADAQTLREIKECS